MSDVLYSIVLSFGYCSDGECAAVVSSYLWLDLIDSYRFPNKYVTPTDTVQV